MADQPVTREKLINADIDVDNLGKAANELGTVNPRYGNPYKTAPQTIQDLQQKADQVVAQGFYQGYTTEALLLAAKPAVAEMRARADDTRKIYRWNRTSAEGVTPVTGNWVDTGLSDKDLAAADATTKANTAKSEAITAAATDATTKANAAEANAKTYTDSKTPSMHITEKFAFSIADENGNSLASLEGDGTLKVAGSLKASGSLDAGGSLKAAGPLKAHSIEDANGLISSELQPKENISAYAFSVADENGNPILKIKKDGTLVVESVEDKNGAVGSSGVPLDKIFNNVSQFDIFINHGQSNGSGYNPTTAPPVTTVQLYNNKIYNGTDLVDVAIASDGYERPNYNFVNQLSYMTLRDTSLNVSDLSSQNVTFSVAATGTGIINLYNDRGPYATCLEWLTNIKAYCDANGIICNVKAMLFTHGEFDAVDMTMDEYLGHQYALYNKFNDSIKQITGQKNDMKFLTWVLGADNAGEAQIKAYYEHPNMLVAFPKYCGYFADGTHLSNIGSALAGAYYAKAYRYHFEQGRDWKPLMRTAVKRYGTNAVKVTYNRKGLTFDSSRFSATGGGFYGSDASGALTVSSYEVNSSSDVIVTFNRDIVGDLTFGYGIRTARTDNGIQFGGTLRDNEGMSETTEIAGTVYPLHNWALMFEEVVK